MIPCDLGLTAMGRLETSCVDQDHEAIRQSALASLLNRLAAPIAASSGKN